MLEKHTRLVNIKTGEVLSRQVRPIAPVFDEEKGYLFWPRKSFMKSFLDIEFPEPMSYREIGQMTTLAKKMCPKTNMLGYRGNGGTRPYTIPKIGEVLGLKSSQAYAFVRKVIRLGVVAEVKIRVAETTEKQYYVNPIYYFSGNRIPLNLYLIFRHELDRYLPGWVKEEYCRQTKAPGKATSK